MGAHNSCADGLESAGERTGGGKRDGHTHNYILTHSIIGEISGHKNNALHLAKAKWREAKKKERKKKKKKK